MDKPIIEIRNLSKRYRLGAVGSTTVRDAVERWWTRVRAGGPAITRSDRKSFWALRDLSLTVEQGEVLGLIGPNGAGKSTLLKILSRITEPTGGEIILRGRVGCLLEVGAGFHPELSGRENIFLNGAILGMKRAEVARKLDQIVAFAEIGPFIDTPVKRYSSGMYVRLAFAIAAHLEPEILIVDEVLAVGDAQFQRKCLGKMQDVAGHGRTVLFVSHNMATIRQLCRSAAYLRQGALAARGTVADVIAAYLADTGSVSGIRRVGAHGLELTEMCFRDEETGSPTSRPIFSRDYRLVMVLRSAAPMPRAAIVVEIRDSMGTLVSSACSVEEGVDPFTIGDRTELSFALRELPLLPGAYRASLLVYQWGEAEPSLEAPNALDFEVQPSIVSNAMWAYRPDHGVVRLARGAELSVS